MAALPYALFGLSGFAALLYEVVWTRRLLLVFGATVHSASAVLAGFMAGFALGGLAGGFLARRSKDPWRLYGWLEIGVAGAACLFPPTVRWLLSLAEQGWLQAGPWRLAAGLAAVFPAAFLMGATFPVLAQHVARRDPHQGVGLLYGSNLIGACLGTLIGAFLMIGLWGLSGTHALAVAINLVAGSAALLIPQPSGGAATEPPKASTSLRWGVAAAVFVSGLCGMAFEIVWTRLLIPSFNNSAYGFASMLFVFLAGLGIGSLLAVRLTRPSLAGLGAILATSALYGIVGYGAFELSQLLQIRFCRLDYAGVRPMVLLPLAEACVVLAPLAILQGMLLPSAARLLGGGGASLGRLYAFNTVGAIAGSLAAGFWWIPHYNVQNTLFIVVAVGLLSGTALASSAIERVRLRPLLPVAAIAVLAASWSWFGRRHLPAALLSDWVSRSSFQKPLLLFYADDLEASVAAFMEGPGARSLIINSIRVTGYTNATKMMAHIPLLLHPRPERTLIICFGMGTTFRSALQHEGKVDVVELVPAVYRAFQFFFPDAARWAADPRARLLANDGRNHLLAEREGYDVIIADPSPPLFATGTVNLYDRDFFELARRRLKPGGIAAVWIPAYPETEFQMVMKSFVAAFPETQIWRATRSLRGILMLGSEKPIRLDERRIGRRLREPAVRADMLQFDREFEKASAFWGLYLGEGRHFEEYLRGVPELTDDFPRIEYPYFRSQRRDYLRFPAFFSWPDSRFAKPPR